MASFRSSKQEWQEWTDINVRVHAGVPVSILSLDQREPTHQRQNWLKSLTRAAPYGSEMMRIYDEVDHALSGRGLLGFVVALYICGAPSNVERFILTPCIEKLVMVSVHVA